MKIVVYFSMPDVDAARKIMVQLKAEGKNVHWASADEFQAPRDLEYVDHVILASPAPRVEEAYAARKVKVTRAYEGKPETAPQPDPEPEAAPEITEEEMAPEPLSELDALREEAEELGVDIDGRWGASKLREKIEEARG